MKYLFTLALLFTATIVHATGWTPGIHQATFTITKAVAPLKNGKGSIDINVKSNGTFTGKQTFIVSNSVKLAITGKVNSNGVITWSGGENFKTNQFSGTGQVNFIGFAKMTTAKGAKATVTISTL